MAHGNLKDDLKKYLPEAQQGSADFDSFLDAIGELLDGFHDSIDDFKYYYDYQLVSEKNLDLLSEELDLDFPRNLSLSRKRETVKDAIDLWRSNGTERALKRIFRLIGWDVDIDYCWTLNPAVVADVSYVYNGTINYSDTAGYTYNDSGDVSPVGLQSLIYGSATVYDNGTYADLYDEAANFYFKVPIQGEEYPADKHSDVTIVLKAPYIRINIKKEDYDIFTQDIVDPESGTVYSYTAGETFAITQEIINYFLEKVRPANVAIIEISTPFSLLDDIDLDFQLSDPTFTTTSLSVATLYDGTLSYGTGIDRYALGENFDGFEYGTTTMNYIASPTPTLVQRSYAIGTSGVQGYVPTWKEASIDLTVPSDAIVFLIKTMNDRTTIANGNATWVLVDGYNNVTNEIINISDAFAIAIYIYTPSAIGTIVMDTTLSH